MAKQKQTAAQAYRAQRRQILESQKGVEVELPSGFTFELKKVDVQVYIRSGRLPDSLLKRGASGWKKLAELAASDPEALGEKDAQDAVSALVFMRDVVQEACVNPRIVPGTEDPDELDPKDLSEEDFNFIFEWATYQEKGGRAESLGKFRR